MTEYNFTPDYKKWWNKKDLTEDDLSWLVLGVNPDDARKVIELTRQGQIAGVNDDGFLRAFDNYADTLPHGQFLGNTRQSILDAELWGKKGKEDFIFGFYEQMPQLSLPDAFRQFLESKKLTCDHFDHYKTHEQYRADLAKVKLKDISDEDKAISYLFGLNPEFFLKFYEQNGTGKYEKDMTPEYRFFSHQYLLFLRKEYPHLEMMPHASLFSFYKAAKELSLWAGNFSAYVQTLHDEGFLLPQKTYDALRRHQIIPVYSENGWAMQFYKRWIPCHICCGYAE